MLDFLDRTFGALSGPELDEQELDRLLGVVKRQSTRRHRRRRAATVAVAGVMALLLAMASIVVGQPSGEHRPASRTRVTVGAVAAPKWRLVSDMSGGWRVSPGSLGEGGFLTCPAAGTCYAGDAEALDTTPCCNGVLATVEVTHDGGDRWQSSELPVALSAAGSPSCSDAVTCAILGFPADGPSVLLRTTNGGKSWTTTAGPVALTTTTGAPGWSPWPPFIELACTSAATCVAATTELGVDQPAGQAPADEPGVSRAFSTGDGGRTWTTSSLPYGFVAEGLACADSGSCVVTGMQSPPNGAQTGAALFRAAAGAPWTAASLPPDAGPLSAVSCTSGTSDCLATFWGGAVEPIHHQRISVVLATTDGGRSWSPVAADSLPVSLVTGISCTSARSCSSSELLLGLPTWGSVSWSGSPTTPGAGVVVQAASSGTVIGSVASTSDGGATWTSAHLPPGISSVTSISCPDAADCYALAVEGSPPERQVYVLLSDSPAS